MRRSRRAWRALALLALLVAGALLGVSRASAGDAGAGKTVFDQSCAACHSIGGGDLVGPDLAGVADRREAEWVKQFILVPDEVIASGDPIAKELLAKYGTPMPNLGITPTQADDLLAFLGFSAATPTQTETQTETEPTPQPEPAPEGSATAGEHYFTGASRFESGGPSCLSCHSIAGVGALGGGQLGPDLTNALAKLGGVKGLVAWLEAGGSVTMAPIYSRKPLTAEERNDLAAFLERAPDAQRSSQGMGELLLLSLGVLVLLAVLGLLIWRRRLIGVRKQLVETSTVRGR